MACLLSTMYFSAILVILSAFGFYSGYAGPIQFKLKLSNALRANNDVCPPGVWTCSSRKGSDTSKSSFDTLVEPLKMSQPTEHASPPGVWTCSTGKRSQITQEAAVIAMAPIHKDELDDPENCSLGNWVCKRKRMLKQTLKEALNKPRPCKMIAHRVSGHVQQDSDKKILAKSKLKLKLYS